jgi:hypothetical protein
MVGTTKPQLQGMFGTTNPQLQGMVGTTNPQLQGMADAAHPQLQGLVGTTNPQLQGLVNSTHSNLHTHNTHTLSEHPSLLQGAWAFDGFTLFVDWVQGDAYASPSRCRWSGSGPPEWGASVWREGHACAAVVMNGYRVGRALGLGMEGRVALGRCAARGIAWPGVDGCLSLLGHTFLGSCVGI